MPTCINCNVNPVAEGVLICADCRGTDGPSVPSIVPDLLPMIRLPRHDDADDAPPDYDDDE